MFGWWKSWRRLPELERQIERLGVELEEAKILAVHARILGLIGLDALFRDEFCIDIDLAGAIRSDASVSDVIQLARDEIRLFSDSLPK